MFRYSGLIYKVYTEMRVLGEGYPSQRGLVELLMLLDLVGHAPVSVRGWITNYNGRFFQAIFPSKMRRPTRSLCCLAFLSIQGSACAPPTPWVTDRSCCLRLVHLFVRRTNFVTVQHIVPTRRRLDFQVGLYCTSDNLDLIWQPSALVQSIYDDAPRYLVLEVCPVLLQYVHTWRILNLIHASAEGKLHSGALRAM